MFLIQLLHDHKSIIRVLHMNVGSHQRVATDGQHVLGDGEIDSDLLTVDVWEMKSYLRCEEGRVCGRLGVRGAWHDCAEACHVRVERTWWDRRRRGWWW